MKLCLTNFNSLHNKNIVVIFLTVDIEAMIAFFLSSWSLDTVVMGSNHGMGKY